MQKPYTQLSLVALLKLLTGEIQPVKGEVKRNPRLRMGIYNQHFVDRLPMGKTPVEHLRDRYQDEDYQSIRNRLGKYGLEGHAHEVTMRDLSGGQKARVVFVDLSLLDEPNDVQKNLHSLIPFTEITWTF